MRTLRFLGAALGGFALLSPPAPTAAQGQTLAFAYQLTVPGAQGPAFEAAWKEHMAFREANGETWTWSVFQQTFGPDAGTYLIRSAGHSWADLDSYFTGEFATLTQRHLQATVAPMVTSFTSGVTTTNAELSHPAENVAAMNVFPVTTFYLEAEGQQRFMESMGALKEALVASAYPFRYSVQIPVAGPVAGPSVLVVGQSATFAGLEQSDEEFNEMFVGHFGEERAQEILEAFNAGIERTESVIYTLRRDLSSGS